MKVDVSEVKARMSCGRKWSFNSRNFFHLRPAEFPKALHFGTVFHTALARMYKGNDFAWLLESALSELEDPKDKKMMDKMLSGYFSGPYQEDKDQFKVVDIEFHFSFDIETGEVEPITAAGSIDLVLEEIETGLIYGFEHKTAANFRPEIYNFLDEQPRVYTLALQKLCELKGWPFGGIVLNEVRKLTSGFQYNRTLCKYEEVDLNHFYKHFVQAAASIADEASCGKQPYPCPSFFGCNMCEFSVVCAKYGYQPVTLEKLLEVCGEEFSVRLQDHLEEK